MIKRYRIYEAMLNRYSHILTRDYAQVRPLAKGIFQEAWADVQANPFEIDQPNAGYLQAFFAWYCRRMDYLAVMSRGGTRYNLAGEPCGEVTEAERADAKAEIIRRELSFKEEAAARRVAYEEYLVRKAAKKAKRKEKRRAKRQAAAAARAAAARGQAPGAPGTAPTQHPSASGQTPGPFQARRIQGEHGGPESRSPRTEPTVPVAVKQA